MRVELESLVMPFRELFRMTRGLDNQSNTLRSLQMTGWPCCVQVAQLRLVAPRVSKHCTIFCVISDETFIKHFASFLSPVPEVELLYSWFLPNNLPAPSVPFLFHLVSTFQPKSTVCLNRLYALYPVFTE